MSNLSFKQILIIAGFLLILISIPLSFSLLKNSQIFQSQASNEKVPATINQHITKVATKSATATQEVPADSPLSDLKKMLEDAPGSSSTAPGTAEPTPTPAVNLAFGPTLNFKVTLEGRPEGKNAAKVFVGIASGNVTTKPTFILTFTVDVPDSGAFSGLSLAGLNPGSTYTAYIKGPGQVDSASTFSMGATETNLNQGQALNLLSGDLNEDNTINSADYTVAKSLYGATSSSSNWNPRADFNNDGVINNLDLAYVTKNFGKTGDSGVWYSPTPTASASATPTPGSGGGPQGNIEGISTSSAKQSGGYDSPNGFSNRSGGYWMWVPAL